MMRTSTVEDTLKVMEISAQCLKLDMDKHSRTSFQTFKKKTHAWYSLCWKQDVIFIYKQHLMSKDGAVQQLDLP